MAPSKNQIPLKVLIHKEEKRVLFAEANSDFVDILFSFLTMPMGTTVRLLSKNSNSSQQPTVGSFNNLYKSISNLEAEYFKSEACKDMLLNTRNSAERECQKLKINIDDIKRVDYFTCEDMNCTENNSPSYLSTYNNVQCKNCYKFLNRKARVITTTVGGHQQGVFVPPNASFVITDDLQVIPNIPSSIFALFKSSGLTDFGVLEEKTFNIGSTEILDLLRYSILSRTPLTRMFLGSNELIINRSVQPANSKMSTEGIISFFCFILRKCFISLKKMRVKVLVQKSSSKILLAHCSEDFIDFLFNFLTLPLGRVISLLKSEHSPALCVGNIHQSVSNLNVGEYIKSQKMKDILLCPQYSMFDLFSNQHFPFKEESIPKFYSSSTVSGGHFYFYYLTTEYSGLHNCELNLVSPVGEGGFLRGATKFMVTDDLVVAPLSSMSCIKYIQGLNISPSDIEEQVINIGREEAFTLLRESLMSTSVLTNGLKHLIRIKPDTEKLVKKLSGTESLEEAKNLMRELRSSASAPTKDQAKNIQRLLLSSASALKNDLEQLKRSMPGGAKRD